uniref:Protein kinase domain-containing protein n=1 Tax=Gouania willdenowi TaxID=441366 RepID=A0A8C5G1N7_GOUWI
MFNVYTQCVSTMHPRMNAEDFQPVAGQVLQSSYNAFTILEFIGEGAFGKVAKCQVNGSNAIVAVKILKQEIEEDVEHELGMLEAIGQLNADQVHVIKLYEIFQHCGHTCLVFEMLDIDLFQHCLNKNSLYVNAIRPIAKQLLETLQALQYLKIVHTDIKPDNVMLINMKYLPYRVKLIDFGKALHYYTSKLGGMHQAVGYRAPEVTLGLPFTESIDMWGLGCLLAFLYLGFHLFPVHCEHLMLRCMKGMYTKYFFCEEDEFDRKAFIDLLKKMLRLDGAKRISPTEALQHPFITMSHLSHDPRSRDYLTEIKVDGMTISVYPDYTSRVAKARAGFNATRQQLRGLEGVKYGILYPGRLIIM